MSIAWIGLVVGRTGLSFVTSCTLGITAEQILATLRGRLYDHLQLLPLSYFDEQRRGDLLSLLTNDAAAISNFVTGTIIGLLPSVLTFTGAAIMLCWLNIKIGLITLCFLPVYIVATRLIGRRIRPLSRQWVDSYGLMVAQVEENLGLLPTIKSFTREEKESENFRLQNNRLLLLSKRQLMIYSALPSITMLLAGLGILVLLAVGYKEINSGTMTPAELVSLSFFAMLLLQPLSQLANAYGQLQRTRGASERIMTFLDIEREPLNEGSENVIVNNGLIQLKKVCFSYPTGEQILKDLTVDISPRETVAIVGQNGTGKTTLAHLIMRLIEPDAGSIYIDDTDISQVKLRVLREQIGLVAQHTLLLNGTVAENIGWGKALSSQQDIETAAKAAKAHEFICQLPQGYDTIIGDQGLKLSGGQRQRLSLARALLKNPPILILDEATSMFDPAAEAAFLKDCRDLFAERTVLLITHRPASLAVADRVLLMKDGKLSEVHNVEHYLRTGENPAHNALQG